MHPILLEIGPLAIRSFGVLVLLGFLAGGAQVASLGELRGLARADLWRLNLLVLAAVLVGGRAMFVVVEALRTGVRWNDGARLTALLVHGGLAFYGGLLLTLIVVLWYARRRAWPTAVLCDLYAIGGFLGEGIGRLGCFLAGDDYGKPAPGLAWAVAFDDPRSEVPPALRGVPLHPTQLYLAALAFGIFALGRMLYPRRRFDGQVAAVSLLVYAALRPLIEVFRGDEIRGLVVREPFEISTSQLLSPLFLAIGLALWRFGAARARGTSRARQRSPAATASSRPPSSPPSSPLGGGGSPVVPLLLVVAGAVGLRAIAIWSAGPSLLRFGDAASYLGAATTLCSGRGYSWSSNLPFFRPPGLPLFIALVSACHPESIALVKAALALLDGGTVVLAFVVARAIGMSDRPALLAAGLVAIDPFLVQASSDVASEPLATFLVAAWLAATLRALGERGRDRDRPRLWLVAGIAAGLAALTRPAALVCLPLGLAVAALAAGGHLPRLVRQSTLLVLGAMLVITPWSAIASRASGGFVLVTDGSGYNLWRGMHPDLAQAASSPDAETFLRESARFEEETSPHAAAEVAGRATTLAERNAEWRRLALINLRADPTGAAAFLFRKTRAYFRPWPDRSVSPTWLVLAGAAFGVPVLVGGVVGLFRLARRRPIEACLLGLCLIAPCLAQLPFQVASRFRLPFCEVPLCVLTAGLWRDRMANAAERFDSGSV